MFTSVPSTLRILLLALAVTFSAFSQPTAVITAGSGITAQGPHSLAAIIQLNKDAAVRMEKFVSDRAVAEYEFAHANWLQNEPIRAAFKLPAIPEPQAPEKVRYVLNENTLLITVVSGPDRHPRLFPPPPPPPPPAKTYQMGEFWPGRQDIRLPAAGNHALIEGEETKDEKGQAWIFRRNPFGGQYWQAK